MTIGQDFNNTSAKNTHLTAEVYTLIRAWSVIPVLGNHADEQEKAPAVPWAAYQNRRPTTEKLQEWFLHQQYPAIGIVTGRISQLAVLDFDDDSIYEQFRASAAHLCETYTTRTRRGYHLYFHVPPHLALRSRHGNKVDLQYNGRYVIAPPSVIGGHEYTITRGGQLYTLTEHDLSRFERFFEAAPIVLSKPPENSAERPTTPPEIETEPDQLTEADLLGLYRTAAPQEGRNNALFRLSVLGRDNGLTEQQVLSALAHPHAAQPGHQSHPRETYERRYREATRTIQSAFKRPARSSQHRRSKTTQLSNRLREALMKHQWVFAVRVIDALRLTGIQPGATFTRNEAISRLKGVIGRESIDKALNALLSASERLFERRVSPQTPLYSVASCSSPKETSKCLEVRATKPGKSPPAHRPARIFVMPSNQELATKLGVRQSNISDELTLEDLASAKRTRATLHEAFLRRKPGRHAMSWLSARLGISRRTLQRYNAANNVIRSQKIYEEYIIFWNSLNRIPDELPHQGFFLVTQKGKKYPAKRPLAMKLLAKGERLTLKRQLTNYWWCEGASNAEAALMRFKADVDAIQNQMQPRKTDFYPPPPEDDGVTSVPIGTHPPELPDMSDSPKLVLQPVPGKKPPVDADNEPPTKAPSCRRKLPDAEDEALAKHLRETINNMSVAIEEGQISLKNARQLVITYGAETVKEALERVCGRKNVRKPVGLLVMILRSEANVRRMSNGDGDLIL